MDELHLRDTLERHEKLNVIGIDRFTRRKITLT